MDKATLLELRQEMTLLNDEIYEKLAKIKDFRSKQIHLEQEIHQRIKELQMLTKEDDLTESSKDELTQRNCVVRERFHSLDTNIKLEADEVCEERKQFFKLMGLKVTIKETKNQYLELKIQFRENHECHVSLLYDPITEDYDLSSTSPQLPNFNKIRNYLLETKDIQGFLYQFRKNYITNLVSSS